MWSLEKSNLRRWYSLVKVFTVVEYVLQQLEGLSRLISLITSQSNVSSTNRPLPPLQRGGAGGV